MVCVCVLPSQSILMNVVQLEGKDTKRRSELREQMEQKKKTFSVIIKVGCIMVKLHQTRLLDHMLRSFALAEEGQAFQ